MSLPTHKCHECHEFMEIKKSGEDYILFCPKCEKEAKFGEE